MDCITDISMRGERCIDVGINLRMNCAHKHIHVIASQPGEKIPLHLVFSLLLPLVASLLLRSVCVDPRENFLCEGKNAVRSFPREKKYS